MGINKIILIGHLGRDPEMKYETAQLANEYLSKGRQVYVEVC